MANIHLYKNNPTAGGTDGQLVSEGDGSNPVAIGPLNATNNEESAAIKLAIRCETGYKTIGNTTITPTGTTAPKWAFAPDNAGSAGTFGAYGAKLTIATEVTSVNTIFWAKAKATSDETPTNDTSVDIVLEALIVAI